MQAWSQMTEQQLGSVWQTSSQQAASLQPKPWCTTRQSPAPGSPHPWQSAFARSTQGWSHCVPQQCGSTEQTYVQHSGVLHPGVVDAAKQLLVAVPQAEQNFSAIATHISSQPAVQQAGSMVQTVLQQSTELQPASFSRTSKHDPDACEHALNPPWADAGEAGSSIASSQASPARRTATVRRTRRAGFGDRESAGMVVTGSRDPEGGRPCPS